MPKRCANISGANKAFPQGKNYRVALLWICVDEYANH